MSYDVVIARAALEALLDLRGMPDAVGSALSELDLSLPPQPNSASGDGNLSVMWLGPRHWLLSGPLPREADLAELASRHREDDEVGAVLVSDYYAGFDVSGPQARDVLTQATPLDLRPHVFGHNAASFSDVFGVNGLIHRRTAESYRLYVERSYGDFTHARLRRAAGAPARPSAAFHQRS